METNDRSVKDSASANIFWEETKTKIAHRHFFLMGFIWLVILLGGAILSTLYSGMGHQIANDPYVGDFYKFYFSAERLNKSESIYWPLIDINHCDPNTTNDLELVVKKNSERSPGEMVSCLYPNLNPPAFAVLTLPLARLDYTAAWWVWSLSSLSCAVIALFLISRANIVQAHNSLLASVLTIFGFFAYFPTFANYIYGQVTLLLFLPLTLSWLALRKGNDLTSGAWLGVAASLKPFIGLFLIVLLIKNNWRAGAAFLGVCATAFVLGGYYAGFSSYLDYLQLLGQVTWLESNWNASFSGFFSRIFGGAENIPWINVPHLARALTAICSIGVLVVLARATRRSATWGQAFQADILFATTIPAMLLLSPLGWLYYFPFLFISAVVIWNFSSRLPNRYTYRLTLGLGVAFTIVPRMMMSRSLLSDPYIWFWDAGFCFYTLLIVFFLAVYMVDLADSSQSQT